MGNWLKWVLGLLLFLVGIIGWLVVSFAVVFLSDERQSFSLFSRYDGFVVLENWNLPVNTENIDFDGDGVEDILMWPGCLYLSGETEFSDLGEDEVCVTDWLPSEGYIDKRRGLKLYQDSLPFYSFVGRKSDEGWKYYENWGPYVRVRKFGIGGVESIKPTLAERLDGYWYMLLHASVRMWVNIGE